MLDLVSGLIWLAVIAAFVTPWVRAFLQQRRRPPAGPRPTGGPRSLSQSGGYEPAQPMGPSPSPSPMAEAPPVVRTSMLADRVNAQAPARTPAGAMEGMLPRSASSRPVPADQVRGALAAPGTVRQAFVLMEVLNAPLAMREAPRSPNGQMQ